MLRENKSAYHLETEIDRFCTISLIWLDEVALVEGKIMTLDQLTEVIARGEQLDVEFKSDRRLMPDREIYEEVVSLGVCRTYSISPSIVKTA
jgi:hypothetical protein